MRTVRLHDARHSTATTLLALGVDVRIVADILGHSQTRVTSDTYQHVLPAIAQDAAGRLPRTTLAGRRTRSLDLTSVLITSNRETIMIESLAPKVGGRIVRVRRAGGGTGQA